MQSIRYYTVLKAVIGFVLGSISIFFILHPFESSLSHLQIFYKWLLILGTGLFFSVAIFTIDWFPFLKRFQATEKDSFEVGDSIEATKDFKPSKQVEKQTYRFVGASVAGKSHRDEKGEIQVPCQDAHGYASIGEWSVLVVADGAGSYENSRLGSTFCVEQIVAVISPKLQNLVDSDDYSVIWRKTALACFRELKAGMEEFAKDKTVDYHTLGCTINVAVFNGTHLFSAHIGDGRAAYKKQNGKWEAGITPFKGDEPGCTVFITSDYTWENPDECIATSVIPLDEPLDAVVLLTDGMETYSFLCYTKDEYGIYSDPNEPFAPFLDGNISIIRKMYESGKTDGDVLKAWDNYLQNGKKLVDEYDDKTMVIAFKA